MLPIRLSLFLLVFPACFNRSEDSGAARLETFHGVAGPEPLRGSESGVWFDSTTRGDTTFYARGRVVITSVVYLDSQSIRVPDPPPASGLPVGLFGGWEGTALQPHTEVFTMTYGSVSPATLVTRLEAA